MKTISSLILLFSLTMSVCAQTTDEGKKPTGKDETKPETTTPTTSGQVLNIPGGNVLNINGTFPDLSDSERNILENNLIDIEGTMLMRHRGGNGGDTIASEFTTIANNAAIIWEELCKETYFGLCEYLDQYKDMLDKEKRDFVKVLSSPSVLAYDDKPRDAVNFVDAQGGSNIIVSADRWEAIANDYYNKYDKRITIVLHEYFSLLGIESSDYYPRSRELVTLIKNYGYDISKVGTNKSLPESCTMHIEQDESIEDSLFRDMTTFISEKNYTTLAQPTQARFIMKSNLNCDTSGIFNHACSVYTEIVDTLKGREVVYDRLETEKAWIRKSKVIDIVFNKALSGIESCQ